MHTKIFKDVSHKTFRQKLIVSNVALIKQKLTVATMNLATKFSNEPPINVYKTENHHDDNRTDQ
mgnify:CR=1 FL=1